MTTTSGTQKTIWHTDDKVGQVDMRVDIARMDFYRLLILSRSEEDFYFEEAFNRFLSVAQTALSFAVYDEGGLLFHLVNDVKYQKYFSGVLRDPDFCRESRVPLFPQLFDGKYSVLVFKLNTKGFEKSNWIVPIMLDDEQQRKREAEAEIVSHDDYLQRCTWKYFVDEWDGFQTGLKAKAIRSAGNSLESLASNFRLSPRNKGKKLSKWPITQQQAKKLLCSNGPDEDAAALHKSWHKKVRRLFERAMSDASSGLEAQHLMMQLDSDDIATGRKPLPNMIVAYRSFTRTALRNGWNTRLDGYPYDTQLLVRDETGGDNLPIVMFFKEMETLAKQKNGRNKFEAGEDRGNRKRTLYRDVFSHASEKIILERYGENSSISGEFKKIAAKLDQKFWKHLKANGARWCIEVLQGPVGDNARSLVDPVYYSGLIHFNSIFELGGLDRVGTALTAPWTGNERKEFLEQNEDDLLRIVMLYYLFCEMADWGGNTNDFDPGRLEAVLVPIKMRGSVWAVTMHAAYRSEDHQDTEQCCSKNFYQDVPRWMSVYHICTTLKQKNQELFDKVLWGNTLRRIARLLEKSFEELDNVLQYQRAIRSFNNLVEWEQRYVPYALPYISPDGKIYASERVDFDGNSGSSYCVMWEIEDNQHFAAPQPWRCVGTRTFHTAIEIGINRGLTALIRKTNGKDETRDHNN